MALSAQEQPLPLPRSPAQPTHPQVTTTTLCR